MTYPLVAELAEAGIPVTVSCRVLKLTRQPYYRWRNNPIRDADVLRAYRINALHDAHEDDPTFGYRYLADEARRAGWRMSRQTAWKLCSQAGILSSAQRRRRGKGKKAGPPVFDDHVQRVFRADAPNRVWLTDITEHRTTTEGKLYCCAIKDVFSNRIVGYSISDRMTSKLAVDALRNAVARRGDVAGCILHADRGSQGGFNWSSQHLESEVCDGTSSAGFGSGDQTQALLAGAPEVPTPRRGRVLGADREGSACGGRRGSRRRRAGGRCTVVPQGWRHAAIRHQAAAFGQVSLLR
ncbi:hypothetical protein GCM10009823_01820 [Brevibacterium salitolerans]|uniref:Integrase catalytic domain-containing protein n=1 Tax=Brevibacterium salitolerans TaxID=1403566 RepID=A0ABN2W9V6_9MICO